jgi:peptidoglycan/LPS O-acetylase OafA/YrhL
MAGMPWAHRSLLASSGLLLLLLGLWGGLIPFVGPYFHYAYTPDKTWDYSTTRLWLEILPGAGAFLGGFALLVGRSRGLAMLGAIVATAAGAWFTLGTVLSPLWNHNVPLGGTPASATVVMKIAEQIGFFTGLGVVIAALGALALGVVMAMPRIVVPAPRTALVEEDEATQPIAS